MKKIPQEFYYIVSSNGLIFHSPLKANQYRYSTGDKILYCFTVTNEYFKTYKQLVDRYIKYLGDTNKQLQIDFIMNNERN